MKNIYRFNFFILFISVVFFFPAVTFAAENPFPSLSAAAAILMDQDTGTVLYSLNPDKKLPMASTTKVMTAVIALEEGKDKFGDRVVVSKKAGETEGSSYLREGETVLFGDLFKAALIVSSNEAAVAMAEYLCGSEDKFVELMNKRALELGMTNTHYVNSHGLYDENHYSSARDLVVLGRYVYQNCSLITETAYMGYPEAVVIKAEPRGEVTLKNKNKMLSIKIPGVPDAKGIGLKTGYVQKAGRCLISAAERDGLRLIAVVLGSTPEYFNESADILSYGFRNSYVVAADNTDIAGAKISIKNGKTDLLVGVDKILYVPKELASKDEKIIVRYEGKTPSAPILKGDVLPGDIVLLKGDDVLSRRSAVALSSVEVSYVKLWGKIVVAASLALVILIIGVRVYATTAKSTGKRRSSVEKES